MTASSTPTLPKRASFKPAEVCEIAQVKPYVLRSWEAEFPHLGVVKGRGPRVYRRRDVQLVLRLKELLFVDGLTLGGARRRLEEENGVAAASASQPMAEASRTPEARRGIEDLKAGLRDILEMLSGNGSAPPVTAAARSSVRVRVKAAGRRTTHGRKRVAKARR